MFGACLNPDFIWPEEVLQQFAPIGALISVLGLSIWGLGLLVPAVRAPRGLLRKLGIGFALLFLVPFVLAPASDIALRHVGQCAELKKLLIDYEQQTDGLVRDVPTAEEAVGLDPNEVDQSWRVHRLVKPPTFYFQPDGPLVRVRAFRRPGLHAVGIAWSSFNLAYKPETMLLLYSD